jgi:hypothetical protein
MRVEANLWCGEYVSERDKEILFGGEESKEIPADVDWPHLMASLGIFRSISQARQSGWNGPIPKGWSDVTVGKFKNRVCIIKDILDSFDKDNLGEYNTPIT